MNKRNYSNKLHLPDFFDAIENEMYVLVKIWENFPNYYSYSDADFFCLDLKSFTNKILSVGNSYVENGFQVKVLSLSNTHTQIDFYAPDNNDLLDFKFDLHLSIPEYRKVNINKALFYSILENRQTIEVENINSTTKINIPSSTDEMLIRYLEFIEFYDQRADKIKHLEYIQKQIGDGVDKKLFLDKLHIYTKPCLLPVLENTHFSTQINQNKQKQIIGIKQSFGLLLKAIKRRIIYSFRK